MRLFVCFALFALAVSPLYPLDPGKALTQDAHRIWGQEQGLFQPTIYSILQTRDGFLWLGTQDSLIRFDGAQFREIDNPGASVFHDALIRSLLQDGEGNLWVGSVGAGLGKIGRDGSLVHFDSSTGFPADAVYCLDSGHRREIFACTNAGLATFQAGKFHFYTTADGLLSNNVRGTCIAGGTRWVAGIDFGVGTWEGNRFHPFSDHLLKPGDRTTALACGADGAVWVGTTAGLVKLQNGLSRLISERDGLPDNAISSLLSTPDGTLWVGTNDGISRIHGDGIGGNDISVYRTRDGLSHSMVLSLYMDREGSLWAGTKDGLDQFTDGNVTPYTTNQGLLSNETGPVLEDRAGHLCVGTLGWGLNIMENGRVHAVTTREGLAGDYVIALELDRDGDLWVGTSTGVSRLHDGRVVATYRRRDGLPADAVNALVVDTEGVLWAGTSAGLARFADGRFTASTFANGHADANVIALARGNTTRLFVGTETSGLYTLRENAFTPHDLGVPRPVDSIFLDLAHRTAWMGTFGAGLVRWQNGKVARVRVRDGLYDNLIYGILSDDSGNFWISSSKGIFRVSRAQLDSLADGKTHGIESMPFSTGQLRFECRSGVQPAACRTHDGRLWFSTTSGLVMIDPADLRRKYPPPPTQITSVLVNGERVNAAGTLQFEPNQKNVEIRYAGLSFVSPEKVTFRYQLEGFDKNWTEAGGRREAFFTNLPPRRYRFLVYARNANGDVSATPASVDFRVEPTFYQRLWFFPLVGMVLLTAAYFAYRIRLQHLKQRFDLVLAERSRIARELHDTLLQGLSGVTMQLQALWMRMPSSRDKTFLAAVIEDAAACSQEARQSLWGLRTQGSRDEQFSQKLAAVCREVVEGSGVALDLNLQAIGLQSSPETEFQLLRIAREVVSNTVAHADASMLRVSLSINRGQLHLSFEDNGIGFDAESGVQLLDHFGLVGIRERAKEIGAELNLTSAPGSGTTVRVTLPLTNVRSFESNAETGIEHPTR